MAREPDPTEDFATLLAEFEAAQPKSERRARPQVGDRVRGRVVSLGEEIALVDLGQKAEGIIDTAQLRDASGALTVAIGDELEAQVVEIDDSTGTLRLARTLGRGPDGSAALEQAHAHGLAVEGLVGAVIKGGVEVQVAGVRAFCPISQLDARYVEDPQRFVGQRLQFRITRYEAGGRGRGPNVVLSRRDLLEEEAAARASELKAHLKVGLVLDGTVTSLKDYGAFVDLGGLEGMLHVSELGHSRVTKPGDVLQLGQRVQVQVIKIEEGTAGKRGPRIGLSLKALERDPWGDLAVRLPEGTRRAGKVARLEPFGAFVELEPGIEGLLHISQLVTDRPLRHAKEALSVGETVKVQVISVEPERHRISLALAPSDEDGGEAVAAPAGGAAPKSLGTFGDLLKGAQAKPRPARKN
ncbi:MAG: S1 RNA-binding domain-containing protein [Deltaproteobacteria bacterium]|nr:S1 RNA-binding domain-containing protein [Deltaproteobacteria bacterium]